MSNELRLAREDKNSKPTQVTQALSSNPWASQVSFHPADEPLVFSERIGLNHNDNNSVSELKNCQQQQDSSGEQ